MELSWIGKMCWISTSKLTQKSFASVVGIIRETQWIDNVLESGLSPGMPNCPIGKACPGICLLWFSFVYFIPCLWEPWAQINFPNSKCHMQVEYLIRCGHSTLGRMIAGPMGGLLLISHTASGDEIWKGTTMTTPGNGLFLFSFYHRSGESMLFFCP